MDGIVGAAEQVAAGQHRLHRRFAGGEMGSDGPHGQIVRDGDALKAQLLPQVAVDLGGEGGREFGVKSGDRIVADHDRTAAGLDAHAEGDQVSGFQSTQAPPVQGGDRVGIGIAAVAGEMLQDAAEAVPAVNFNGAPNELSRGQGILAQGPRIDEGPGIPGHIRHRAHIHIDAQPPQEQGLFFLRGQDGLHAALPEIGPGASEGRFPEGGEAADPGDGAALLVHRDQQRHVGGLLEALQLPFDILRGLALQIHGEEDIAAQVIFLKVLRGSGLGIPGQEQLAHPLLQGHMVQELPDRIRGRGGLRHRFGRGLRDGGHKGLLRWGRSRGGLRRRGGASAKQRRAYEDVQQLSHDGLRILDGASVFFSIQQKRASVDPQKQKEMTLDYLIFFDLR